MTTAREPIPQEWSELFEGRRVVIATLPLSNRVTSSPRRRTRIIARTVFFTLLAGLAASLSDVLGWATGRWWIGALVFVPLGWLAWIVVARFFRRVKAAMKSVEERRAIAMDDPIGRLLPAGWDSSPLASDPNTYAPMFALSDRPIVVFEHQLLGAIDLSKVIGTLASRGRLPEPEALATSRRMGGTSFAGVVLLVQMNGILVEGFSPRPGTASTRLFLAAVLLVLVAAAMIVSDPWLHRLLRISNVFRADAVIGAGWLRDTKGRVFTVDESMLLITLEHKNIRVRCINAQSVADFYLPIRLPKKKASLTSMSQRQWAWAAIAARTRRSSAQAAKAVGFDTSAASDSDMPSSDQPLRLLLSSWTYPEPRTDLARVSQ